MKRLDDLAELGDVVLHELATMSVNKLVISGANRPLAEHIAVTLIECGHMAGRSEASGESVERMSRLVARVRA